MRNCKFPLSSLLTAAALAAATLLASCGGSDSDSSGLVDVPITTPANASIPYRQGDLSATDPRLQKMTSSLATTSGALLQAIFAVNSFVFTDPKVTDYATYVQRHADANKALGVLILYAGKTEQNADAFGSAVTGRLALQSPRSIPSFLKAAASPEEVLAVLSSSKSVWPIKTLMQQYQVSAKRAQLILNNAMAGITSQAYLDQATVETQTITRLALVRDASALTVAVGGSVVTMGAAAAAGTTLTGFEVGSAIIATADAAIKVTKSGAELAIGQDGALDSAFEKSMVVRTIADVNELVSIKGLFAKSVNGLDVANKLTWVGGKLSEVFQEKKVSFGAESLTLTDLDASFKASYLERVKGLKYPTTFPGNYIDAAKQQVTVSPTEMPQIVLEALDTLPVEAQLAIVQQILPDSADVPVIGNGITLAATKASSDDTSITYTVSANIQGVRSPTSVVMSVANASVLNASRTLAADGVLTWSVTVLGQKGTVTVTRGDNGASLSTTLTGQEMNFDGTYNGIAVTTFEAENVFCWDSTEVGVTVSGSALGGDVVGTVRGNVVSGTYPSQGLTFSGTISGTSMKGNWNDPQGGCSGNFSLTKQ